MIEHHVPLVVRVCDYVYCLNFGQLLAEGRPDEVRNHPQVITAYLGEDAEDPALQAVEGAIESLLDSD
jgi:branched-chain amino acid transport system ATP-binding protein